jgi:16S rRNA (guanine527-N7)-methyltransferase
VSARKLRERLTRRARTASLELSDDLLAGLELYFAELARWNRKINLTAFRLDPAPSDAAVDRLLVEPVLAARYLPATATSLLDIGSGGGSPAIPMKLARPDLTLRMVESKVRKSVFLRQAARALALGDTHVETARFEELLTRPDLHESMSAASIRAVKVEPHTLLTIQAFLEPGGHLLSFIAGQGPIVAPPSPLRREAVHDLIPQNQSRLLILVKDHRG